ncbi:MAG TPA: RHS repeat-associated core domain-containing protein, partial [Thermomicrobiaceae bacterium]|nr:RHS repeat-associated core domain-containing protein [Thermomicrobiaceae bacterium]
LVYLRARYYDPSTGRFLAQDPLGFTGSGVNLYAYVSNDPVNASDPSGLWGVASAPGMGGASLAGRQACGGTTRLVDDELAGGGGGGPISIAVPADPSLGGLGDALIAGAKAFGAVGSGIISILNSDAGPEVHQASPTLLPRSGERPYMPPKQKGNPPFVRDPGGGFIDQEAISGSEERSTCWSTLGCPTQGW